MHTPFLPSSGSHGSNKRQLPPLLLKGAAAMAEDAESIGRALFFACSSDSDSDSGRGSGSEDNHERRHAKRRKRVHRSDACSSSSSSSCCRVIMDLVARSEIVGLVGNCFSASRCSISTWPTLKTQGGMMCRHPFDFDHLFSTYATYLDPRTQVGSVELEGLREMQQVEGTLRGIQQRMAMESPLLRGTAGSSGSNSCSIVRHASSGGDASSYSEMLCWTLSPALHRVILRTVLLDHFSRVVREDDGSTMTEREMRLLLTNIQTMIVKMQVLNHASVQNCVSVDVSGDEWTMSVKTASVQNCVSVDVSGDEWRLQASSSKGTHVNFAKNRDDGTIHAFLDSNEQILEGTVLFDLCTHPGYDMQPGTLAMAVALYVAPRIHEACMNKDDMLSAFQQREAAGQQDEAAAAVPSWWLCNDEEQDAGARPFASSTSLLPIVRLHPAHAEDNDRLCVECRGILEDPELYWPFLEREQIIPYHGWVDFVAEEVVLKGERQVWLCAKLLEDARRIVS